MIINYQDHPIKQVPKKYIKIKNITDFLEDEYCIRLTAPERKSLDQELFRLEAENFLMLLSLTDPLTFEHVKDAKPVAAGKVKDADGETCSVLLMSNGLHVRCDETLCSISPIKFRPAKENVEQTKCF